MKGRDLDNIHLKQRSKKGVQWGKFQPKLAARAGNLLKSDAIDLYISLKGMQKANGISREFGAVSVYVVCLSAVKCLSYKIGQH